MLYEMNEACKIFENKTVLEIPELSIEAGKIIAILGENGSGKTTFLKILAFLSRLSSGLLYFRSIPVEYNSSLNQIRRVVTLVEQHPILFSGSVYDNIEYGLKIRKVKRNKRNTLIHETLEMVGMEKFSTQHAKTLSGGQTKRIALARALIFKPDVLLCDEPTASVDTENKTIILEILKKINKRYKISVIFSTHNPNQAEILAHRVLYFQQGRLVGPSPINLFYALITHQDEERIYIDIENIKTLKLPKKINFRFQHKKIQLTINPDRILINHCSGSTVNNHHFTGLVKTITAHRNNIHVIVENNIKIVISLSLKKYRETAINVGQKVSLIIPPEAVSILEA